jgi:hypothetical protein
MRSFTVYDATSGRIRSSATYSREAAVHLNANEAIYYGWVDPATHYIDVMAVPPEPVLKSPAIASVSKLDPAIDEIFTVSLGQRSFVSVLDDVGDMLVRRWVPAGDHNIKIESAGGYIFHVYSDIQTPITLTVVVA